MSKYTITVTKSEIIEAILRYVNDEVTISGRKELDEPTISFTNKDGEIGYFEALIEVSPPNKLNITKG